jgi:CheY-like chemotaxis protein
MGAEALARSATRAGKRRDKTIVDARPRIILIGGHPLVAAMFAEHLHHADRYEIESVQYCDDALAVLQRQRFDLVLVLSLHVPWRRWPRGYSAARRIANAIRFLKHMRALPDPPPVILVSGSPHAEVEKHALAHGAFAFIPKPFDLAELDRFVVLALESQNGRE